MRRQKQYGQMNRSGKEGSALITAMIMTFVVALIMSSYLYLASSEYRVATRSFMMGASFALAEGGIDQAIDALNDEDNTGWTVSGSTWSRTFTSGLDVTTGATGAIRVVVLDASSKDPTIYSEGIVAGHTTGDVSKQIKVKLTQGVFLGDSGFIADAITNNGNQVSIQQFDSRLGDPGETLSDGSVNQSDEIRVSTASLTGGAINVGNSDIYGYIATGGGDPDFGPQGGLYSYDDPDVHDPSRITFDFYAEFEPETGPSGTWTPIYTAPASGTALPSQQYELDGDDSVLKTTNGEDITIDGDVVIWVTDKGSISLGGNLTINEGASLVIYTNGDVNISGEINNSNTALNFTIYGTNTTDGEQTIKLNGGAELTAFVYAPTANVEIKGGGGTDVGIFNGAVVAYDAVITGNMTFWYDRALGDLNLGENDFAVTEWIELTDTTTETAKVDLATFFP